jgi:Bacterial PH domain
MTEAKPYDDGKIACDSTGLLIRWYYPWGSKRIPYTSIRSIHRLPIRIRRWRLWGSGDLRHWWNLDFSRPRDKVALDIDTGHWIHPTITPDDPDTVERILNERLAGFEPASKP